MKVTLILPLIYLERFMCFTHLSFGWCELLSGIVIQFIWRFK